MTNNWILKSITVGILFCWMFAWAGFSQDGDDAFKEAEDLLRQAYEESDSKAAGALVTNALDRLAKAKTDLEKEARYFILQGYLLEFSGRNKEAAESFAAAIKLDPKNPEPHFKRGEILYYAGKAAEAVPVLQKATELGPTHAGGFYMLGQAYTDLAVAEDFAHWIDAEKAYRQALKFAPGNRRILRGIAMTDTSLGRHEDALAIWKAEVKASPDDMIARWNLAQTLQNKSAHQEAYDIFLKVYQEDPTDWRALEKLIQLSEAMGKEKQRDLHHGKMYELYASPECPERLKEQRFFIRDQFQAGKLKVYGMEYFKLIGARGVKFSFGVKHEAPGKEPVAVNRITLGSYDSTTAIARETGDIGPKERIYHLDAYPPDGSHHTLHFFIKNPGYGKAKALTIEALKGKLEAISSTIPDAPAKLKE